MQVQEITDIKDERLKQYFQNRCISFENAQAYCKQVFVQLGYQKVPMIAFKNQSGGYELRGISDFKSTIPPKDFTFFDKQKGALAVVEGMFDFLTVLEKQKDILPELTNFLVLNSLSFFEKALPVMKRHGRVYLLLDNDAAGKSCVAAVSKLSQKFTDLSHHYKDHKDMNEWLMKTSSASLQAREAAVRKETPELKQSSYRGMRF